MKLAIAGCGRIASVHYEAIKQLIQDKNYNISISHTTRKPRNNEIPGKDYYFVNNKEFNVAAEIPMKDQTISSHEITFCFSI